MELSLQLTQQLSQQMLQYMNLLQMNHQELKSYVDELYLENPAIEFRENFAGEKEPGISTRKAPGNTDYKTLIEQTVPVKEGETLEEHLLNQLGRLEPQTRAAAELIIHNLNQNGLLECEAEELMEMSGLTAEDIEAGLQVVQSLEPTGVGARSVKECLLLQLDVSDVLYVPKKEIIDSCLEHLAKNHYHQIAKLLDLPENVVHRACREIKSLQPKPGAGFDGGTEVEYIIPDIIVTIEDGEPEFYLYKGNAPQIGIDEFCNSLIHDTEDERVKDYLRENLKQAEWLIRALDLREQTMLSCMRVIVEHQREFFLHGDGHIKPMTLEMVADAIDMHPSTVSRAVSDKYVQCNHGTYPLKKLFAREIRDESKQGSLSYSPDQVKKLLQEILREEDPKKPLSDHEIVKRLFLRGCDVSRRTIAKYRSELGIPNTSGRKKC